LSLFTNKYTTYRYDHLSREGGGVMIAVDSDLPELVSCLPYIEYVAIKLTVFQTSVYITFCLS